jgi:hypothetical protein
MMRFKIIKCKPFVLKKISSLPMTIKKIFSAAPLQKIQIATKTQRHEAEKMLRIFP